LEDKLLIWKLNRGREDALRRIYEKYRDRLVRIAAGLLNNSAAAEDVVQDVFLMLGRAHGNYEIKKNLRGYLTSCVANRVRNLNRRKGITDNVSLDHAGPAVSNAEAPDQRVLCDEEFRRLYQAVARLPFEQKEAVILRLQAKMKFRQIAQLQETSIKTTLSRYNYGLNKLRSILNSEVQK
jgi:RNA polymerase sigma-70 factor (ECF subfamily)